MATLKDLATVVYQPRQTMRRVLDGSDRWTPQIVILAYICASTKDTDSKMLTSVLPGLGWSAVAVILLGIIVGAIVWVVLLYLLSWLVAVIGRRMGGVGSTPDVRAAMAWGLVPLIWSVIVWLPFEFVRRQFRYGQDTDAPTAVIDFAARGGCSLMVILLTLQLLVTAWCIYVASCCVGEAQQFSSGKGFASIAVILALPVVIALAVIASQHLHF